jgi:uncharacterized protein
VKIPSHSRCYTMMRQVGILDHILRHSEQVCRVALLLADELCAHGRPVNTELIGTAALLHDITKTRSFSTGENHAQTGKEILVQMGYPQVGDIVGQHVHLRGFDPGGPVTEAEVVNYADKRVLHDQIVVLDERMAYILERYGTRPSYRDRIQILWDESRQLEQKLFSGLTRQPDDIAACIEDPFGSRIANR